MADYLTYANIYDAVCNAIGDNGTSGSQARLDEAKINIGLVYQEVLNCDELYPMHWLMDLIDDVLTKDATTITGITKADPGVVTSTGHKLVNGDVIQFGTVTGMTELSNRIAVVTTKAADTWELYDLAGSKINTTNYAAVGTAAVAYHRGVTLSKSFDKIQSYAWHGYVGEVKPIGFNELETSSSFYDPTATGKPSRYLHKQHYTTAGTKTDRIMWFNSPDNNYQARIWGRLAVAPLSAVGDVPQMPFEFHPAIIAGTVARMVKPDGIQIENGMIWPGIYKMHLDAIKTYNRRWWKQNEKTNRSAPYLL